MFCDENGKGMHVSFFGVNGSVDVHLTICSLNVVSEVSGGKECMQKFPIIWLETLGGVMLGTFVFVCV